MIRTCHTHNRKISSNTRKEPKVFPIRKERWIYLAWILASEGWKRRRPKKTSKKSLAIRISLWRRILVKRLVEMWSRRSILKSIRRPANLKMDLYHIVTYLSPIDRLRTWRLRTIWSQRGSLPKSIRTSFRVKTRNIWRTGSTTQPIKTSRTSASSKTKTLAKTLFPRTTSHPKNKNKSHNRIWTKPIMMAHLDWKVPLDWANEACQKDSSQSQTWMTLELSTIQPSLELNRIWTSSFTKGPK